jgi:acyl-CoA thioesterase-2
MNPFEELLAILDLEPIEESIFRGAQAQTTNQRVFGGQVIAQALVAATRTVEKERVAHSLHAYFMRPGDPRVPILYEVDRIRDGKSFTTRRVVAIQHGKAIFSASISYQLDEPGVSHQSAMPPVPPPEDLKSERELLAKERDKLPPEFVKWLERERPIDFRAVEPRHPLSDEKLAPVQHLWMKTVARLPDDPALHKAVMAYASDMSLLGTGLRPHGLSWLKGNVQAASLDHAIWFHRDFRIDEWLLYAQESPSASGARSFNRGELFTREGVLVASVAQEGLMRLRRPTDKPET